MQPAKQAVSQELQKELKSLESGKIAEPKPTAPQQVAETLSKPVTEPKSIAKVNQSKLPQAPENLAKFGKNPEPKPVQRVPPQPPNPNPELPDEESEEEDEEEEEEKPAPKPQPPPEPPKVIEKEKPEDLFDLGEPMPSEMPMYANDESLPVYGPENRPDGWMTPPPKKPDVWLNPSEPPTKATPGWRSPSPIPPTQQQPPPRKVPVRTNNDPVTHRFKRYVRVPRPVRAQKPPEPVWEHNPPPAPPSPTRPVFGPEPKPPDYVSPKPPTPPRRSPIQRQTSDAATLTDVESPVRKPIRTPPRKRSPPKVLLPPAPAEPSQKVSLDPDDEMFWRSSWQDKSTGKQEVSGLLAYTAEDRSPVQQEEIPPPPKCVYHPDCDGNCQ